MKKSFIIVAALLLGVCFSTVSATEVTRFGPKKYVCEKGKPQIITDTFSAEAGVGTFIVENGDADHHHQVSSVKITLNGKMVFGPWAFDHHGKRHRHRVNLVEHNTLAVKVEGRPGSYITVTVIQEVKPPSTAVEVTRFGPKQYVTEKGKPHTVTDTFTAYAGAGKIIVVNGEGQQSHQGRDEDAEHRGWDEDANHRVSSAIITLNGKEVFGPGDFKRHRTHLEADVDLLKNNTLSVKLLGKPGSYLTITVIQLVTPPTITITAAPDAIILGNASTLTWSSTNADKVSIDQGIGVINPSGSRAVTPQESTTYTITAQNDGGTATASVQVTVYIPPTVTLSAAPTSIITGNSATLTWSSTNATAATIDQGIGSVSPSGSITVTPTQTTTYTITVTGPGGTAQATTQVTVINPPTCQISANPGSITQGGSATLSWTSSYAASATINQGIGSVPVSGSITVTPNQTTTYTITVTGPGGTAQATAQVTVINPPTVQIGVSPGTITKGGSTTLSWTSNYAASATIDQGIGAVPVSGSITVTPTQTTTYTITVTGPGGTAQATAQVTVVIPQPTVMISVDPQSIQAGQSATLSWTSTNADSATIDQGIGAVPTTGSRAITPNQTTTYTITVTGAGGTAHASVSVTVITQPMSISITSPADGATILRSDITVEGTITNPTANEVGVTVNGVVAAVYGNQFVASHVPMKQGANTITAIATDAAGNSTSTSITITATIPENYIRITADTEMGISPLETTLHIEGSFSFAQAPVLSYAGPGDAELIENPSPTEYRMRMTTAGIYTFMAEAKDPQNNSYTDTVSVLVLTKAELDALLQEKWSGMKSALGNQDVGKALTYFAADTQGLYRDIYTALGNNLPQIAQDMQNIQFIYAEGRMAKYRIRRDEQQGGQVYPITYYIYFVRDQDGLWKIYQY